MASTYSNLKIELIGTGDQSGTWGVTTNTNLGTAIEEAITGTADVTFASADVTLTLSNTNTTQTARNLRLNLVGTVGAAQNLIVPAIEKQYIINNTLAYDITVKNSTGTGVAVPAGKSMIVFNTGSNVVEVVTALATGTVIPVANGGTGVTTSTGSGSVVLSTAPTLSGATVSSTLTSSGTLAVTGGLTLDGAAGTTGQVLLSAGSGNTPTWGNAFVAGMIMLWSGSSASIPTGWLLCDGTNSTPDLRNRFVVGATSTYAVGATGGSADAIVVSHTHTATVTDPGHNHTPQTLGSAQAGSDNGGAPVDASTGYGTGRTSSVTSTSTTGITVANSTTGSSGTNANLPPYYALCYIMKS